MLGETYAAAGKYAESVRYLRRAIAIIETYEIQTNCDVRSSRWRARPPPPAPSPHRALSSMDCARGLLSMA